MRLLITGAGFSKAWGHPLTAELSAAIQQVLSDIPEEDRHGKAGGHLVQFLQVLDAAQPKGHAPDFEHVLTELRQAIDVDYEQVWKNLGIDADDLFVPDPEYWYNTLQWGLGIALYWTGWAAPPDGLARFWFGVPQAYGRLKDELGPFDATITLNYDVIPEHMAVGPVDYGIPDDDILDVIDYEFDAERGLNGQGIDRITAEARRTFPERSLILKLHGSANMAYCPTCEKALLYPRVLPGGLDPAEQFAWIRTAGYHCTLHCGESLPVSPPLSPGRIRPLMIPPVDNKHELAEWSVLQPVLERAKQIAPEATEVVLVGASVRPTDQALYDVLKKLECPVKLIGAEEAEGRLRGLGLEVTRLRSYLDEGPEDGTNLYPTKRRAKWETITDKTDLGPGVTRDGLRHSRWLKYPEVPFDETLLVVRTGRYAEWLPPRLRKKERRQFPFADLLIDGEVVRHRLPWALSEWAFDRVALAHEGARDIPGRVRILGDGGKPVPVILGP